MIFLLLFSNYAHFNATRKNKTLYKTHYISGYCIVIVQKLQCNLQVHVAVCRQRSSAKLRKHALLRPKMVAPVLSCDNTSNMPSLAVTVLFLYLACCAPCKHVNQLVYVLFFVAHADRTAVTIATGISI